MVHSRVHFLLSGAGIVWPHVSAVGRTRGKEAHADRRMEAGGVEAGASQPTASSESALQDVLGNRPSRVRSTTDITARGNRRPNPRIPCDPDSAVVD